MGSTDDLVDVHAHFTTPHYVEVAKAAGHFFMSASLFRNIAALPKDWVPAWAPRSASNSRGPRNWSSASLAMLRDTSVRTYVKETVNESI
jgi:hypothetical protein